MSYLYLLDTNVISEITKPVPNQNVISKIKENEKMSALCTISWAECLYGLKHMPDGKRKTLITDFYLNAVNNCFKKLPFDEYAAGIYADIKSRLEEQGTPAPELDMQIAAIAISNNIILVTRNISDFKNIQTVSSLMVENWFE